MRVMRKSVFFLLLFTGFNNAYALRVTLYDDVSFQGQSLTVAVTGCKNVLEFNDKASSLKSDGCIKAWANIDCNGKQIKIDSPGGDNLPQRSFNDMITSLSDCSYGKGGFQNFATYPRNIT